MIKNPILTEKGKQLLSKSIANKTAITLSSMALGDGVIGVGATSLAHPVLKQQIENYSYINGQAYVRTTFTNANLETGFYIKEIGIYAIDPDEGEILYSFSYADDEHFDYFSPGIGKVILKEIIEMATGFSDATVINLTIDPKTAMVTVDEFGLYKNEMVISMSELVKLVNERIEKSMIAHNLTTNDANKVLGADVGPGINQSLLNLQNNKVDKIAIPTSLPANGGNADTVDNKHASDFASSIHTHTKAAIGLGNVDNTADANKSVNYANGAGYANYSGTTNQLSVTSYAPASPFAGQLWIW